MQPATSAFANSLPKAWPFEEARKVAERVEASGREVALFETGYGPSGLPHIGTFGEVARTSWVRHAFHVLTGRSSRLIAFSDDMDGLRKVPDNVPNPDELRRYIGQPLSRIPDPFARHASFAAHNNARLQAFLDRFGFDYEFASASDYYASGRFDAALLRVLERHDDIVAAVLPTLGAERAATYSPILPIHPETGVVMQVHIEAIDLAAGKVAWTDPQGDRHETFVTGGRCKLQWKADWAMRWHALEVDYEMSGKDLIDSVRLSGKICRILGSVPPVGFTYELFLDEQAQKISKSRGNGLSVDEWLRYAPPESLAQFMYNQPQRAKRLYFDAIPRAVDEYVGNAEKAQLQSEPDVFANPAWHIHAGHVPADAHTPVSFTMLQNLAATIGATTPEILWGFVRRYSPGASPETEPFLAKLVEHAVSYSQGWVLAHRHRRTPTEMEVAALADLAAELRRLTDGASAEDIQNVLYEVGKRHPFPDLRAWFGCLYQVLLGQDEGPRFGQFAALFGLSETVALIDAALAREAVVA